MMVHFRKRLNLEVVGRINERAVIPAKASGQKEIEAEQKKKEEKLDKNTEEKKEKRSWG
jgi:ribosomal protein L12E/L44/L45/RPP1/RPP2